MKIPKLSAFDECTSNNTAHSYKPWTAIYEKEKEMARPKSTKHGMLNITILTIQVVENGYLVTPNDAVFKGKIFVLPSMGALVEWLKDRMSPTGEEIKTMESI